MGSLWLKPDFQLVHSTETDIKIASVAWGWQLGFTVLTAAKAGAQALKIWRRTHRITGYVWMIWAEILANVVWGVLTWLYLNAIIPPSFTLFFVIVVLWCIELHCLVQIIVNRLSLLLFDERRKFWIKWGAFAYICLLNLSVFIIWTPAQLQYQPWHNINVVWDRVEKCLFLIIDLGLNIYFVYLVKTRLISGGLSKYWPLYRFNVCMVVISVSMDIMIIGMMSMHNSLMYMQFHPVAYMIKLNIEMTMAQLIGKIARSHDNSQFSLSNAASAAQHSHGGGEDGYKSHTKAGRCRGGEPGHKSQSSTNWLFHSREQSQQTDRNTLHGSIGMSDFGPLPSDIADYPDKRYHAWVTAGPAGDVSDVPSESKTQSPRRTPRLTNTWRRSKSDDSDYFAGISFSGISKDTDFTVVAEVADERLSKTSSARNSTMLA